MARAFDLICLGRAAVDLYGQQIGGRLEDMQTFAKYLGGSSANVAVGTARLGVRTSMLTRVGDEHMGRFVREALQREGVDVSRVITDPHRMTALVVLGIEGAGEFPHLFYREHCADMGVSTEDFDERYVASSHALAVTGTHLSTPATRAAVEQALRWARANGTRTILDIDYRPVLWKLTSASRGDARYVASDVVTAALQDVLPWCDLVVGTEEEVQIAGGSSDVLVALRAIRARTPAPIVMKRGADGCIILEGELPSSLEQAVHVPGFPVDVLNVLGAGDAFLSGLLHGWLRGQALVDSARFGNACGALVVSRHGCTPALPSRVELEDFLDRAPTLRRPLRDDRLEHIHHATTVRRPRSELYVLAFDHRRQLEQLADATGAPRAMIARFKDLIAVAVERVARTMQATERLGVIVDSRHGAAALNRLTKRGLWIGRPIEVPGSRPVAFDPHEATAIDLVTWPAAHVVKCLVFYHPDDPLEIRLAQERRLRDLCVAVHRLERELLLEIICSGAGRSVDEQTTARALQRLYNIGLRPSWWKLEPQSPASWRNVASVIEARDPWCSGIVMLGLDSPEETLKLAFRDAAAIRLCRGFAVGRSIFNAAARGWFEGRLSDAAAITDIANRYERLIESWREARANAALDHRELNA